MSKNEKDLSDYISMLSSSMQMYAVIAGFMLTSITLLVTLLPDPSHIMAQATLVTLFVIFALCLLRINGILNVQNYCIRVFPPLPEGFRKRSNYFDLVIWWALGIPLIMMLLLWNLTYLALAAITVNALFGVLWYIHTVQLWKVTRKFETETKKSWHIRKFFDERDIIFESEE